MNDLKAMKLLLYVGYPLLFVGIPFVLHFLDDAKYTLQITLINSGRLLALYFVGILISAIRVHITKKYFKNKNE